MIKDTLHTLKDAILSAAPAFQRGFAEVWQDDETGHVFAAGDGGFLPVFPADDLGNYFYLRTDRKMQMRVDNQMAISDCAADVYTGTFTTHLVATFTGMCEDDALNRLASALVHNGATMQAMTWNREEIIIRELAGADDRDVVAALQRPGNWQIVSITFQLTATLRFQHPKCLPTC